MQINFSGCDPLLRERIWKTLVDFCVNYKMTIIITTHYIEEAKRSSLVAFMKKGALMAENSPENLFKNHLTNSLEAIFYKLCVNDKKLKTLENMKGLLPRSDKTSLSKAEDRKKNFYFYNREL